MYKAALFVYFVTLFCYILFSRVPDYFEGEFVNGTVVQNTSLQKFVQYPVGKQQLSVPLKGWGANQVASGDTVTVIYNPDNPQRPIFILFSLIGSLCTKY